MRTVNADRPSLGEAMVEGFARIKAMNEIACACAARANDSVPFNLDVDGPVDFVGPALTYLLFADADKGSLEDKAGFLEFMKESWPAGWETSWFQPCCETGNIEVAIGFLLHEALRRDRVAMSRSDCVGEA